MNLSTHNESIQETMELVARLTRRVVGIENKTETLQSHLVGINSKLDELMLTLVSEHLCAHSDEEWGRLWRCIIVLGSFVIICLHATPSLVLTPPGVGRTSMPVIRERQILDGNCLGVGRGGRRKVGILNRSESNPAGVR